MRDDMKINSREMELFRYIQKLRLDLDLDTVKEKIQGATADDIPDEDFILVKWGKQLVNTVKGTAMPELERIRGEIEGELSTFSSKYRPAVVAPGELVDKLFGKGFSISKRIFAINVILDTEFKYAYREEGLKLASGILFGNVYELAEIENKLAESYLKIAKAPKSLLDGALLAGSAAVALFLALPAFAASTTAAAGAGAAFRLGEIHLSTSMMTLYACLVGGTVFGACWGTMAHSEKSSARREFRNMSADDCARLLAIRAYIVEVSKENLDPDEFKEQLSDLLLLIDDLRSDVSYELFVEENNIECNREKLTMFHSFDNAMIALCPK